MRKLLVAGGIVAMVLPLLAQSQGRGGGGRGGTLGPVNALGQEVPRPPVRTGPTPRLPDGTVDFDGLWNGGSVGSWEGKDTLVIDTIGFNDKFWFDRKGTPHTEQLHTIERWTRPDLGRLINTVTIEDPGAFSRPFTVTFTARLSPPGDEIMEYICQENNQYGIAGGHENPFNK